MTARCIAIDFGTTNSAAARYDADGTVEVLALPELSAPAVDGQPPLIPSLLYVAQGADAQTVAGWSVKARGLDAVHTDHGSRLFRNFKRGITALPPTPPRLIDGALWSDRDAGAHFLRRLLDHLPDLDQLVLTAPVAAFEGYTTWLASSVDEHLAARVRLVDEATAAALGYAVTEPGAVVLVFDFGGGTLDMALVQLPEHKEQSGGWLNRSRDARPGAARVIAKAGGVLGGSDADRWLLADVLARLGLDSALPEADCDALLTVCEAAKIALSTQDSADLSFDLSGQSYTLTVTRSELETVLERSGFYDTVRHVADKVLHVARRQGIFREDIRCVLMVGGTSLMPSVQAALADLFHDVAVRAEKPFSAVVEGALAFASGHGLDDYLLHGYGLRHLDPVTAQHAFEEVIPAGMHYPTVEPIEIVLGAAHVDQDAIEIVIGEIETDSVASVEVTVEDGQAVFVAQADHSAGHIVPLNADTALRVPLVPAGVPGPDRLRAAFRVDDQRRLHAHITDMQTHRTVLDDTVVVTLR